LIEKTAAVEYRVRIGAKPLLVTILTTYGTPFPHLPGVRLMHLTVGGGPVEVIASRQPPPGFVSAVRRVVRPFDPVHPDAVQVPGDVGVQITRIDTSAHSRAYWVGPFVGGRRAILFLHSPPGVGIVRYGPPGSPGMFYVVTYRPIPEHCSSLGCLSPPPLPRSLRPYGKRISAGLFEGGWEADILAPDPAAARRALRGQFGLTLLKS
jgi:hypothetical protein